MFSLLIGLGIEKAVKTILRCSILAKSTKMLAEVGEGHRRRPQGHEKSELYYF